MNKMGGLGHRMNLTMIFFLIGALAVSGMPPFNGFSSKWMIYESVFKFNPILAIIGLVVSLFTLAAFVKAFYAMFLGAPKEIHKDVTEVPKPMLIAMGILAVFVVGIGLIPNIVVANFVEPAAEALMDQGEYLRRVGQTLAGGV